MAWWARSTRRNLLQAAAAASAVGITVAACAHRGGAAQHSGTASASSSRSAAPTVASNRTVILWAPWKNVSFNQVVGLFKEAITPFLQQNPSLDVRFSPNCCSGASALLASVLAGNSPDLTSEFYPHTVTANHLAVDLMPFVREYNLDLSVFLPGRISIWESGGGLYGLPSYNNIYGNIANITELNARGVALPPADWTTTQASELWAAATHTVDGKKVAGGAISCGHNNAFLPESFVLAAFGGSYVDPADPTRCAAGSKQAIAAGQWVYPQFSAGTVVNTSGGFPNNLTAGRSLMDNFGLNHLLQIVQQLSGFEYDFWPMPAGPAGAYTNAGPDSYMIPVTSRVAKETFALLNWVVTDPTWQTFQMRAMLGAPVVNSLWPSFYAALRAVAPPLATKNIEIFERMGIIHIDQYFTYDNNQVNTIQQHYGQLIQQGMPFQQAFPQMAQQIDAVEQAAASGGKTSA